MNSDQQNPNNSIPTSKKERSKIVGKAAGKIGFKRLGFLAKKTFAGQEKRKELAEQFNEEAAKVLFDAMKKMRGTALKVAQIASMEVDQLPESFRKELSKACYQVPPLNRAVVRKVFINEKGCPPEEVFHKFNYKAFAAASLGQVHLAETKKNEIVAVKLQYPGIADTIHTDLSLLDSILSKMPLLKRFRHTIDEVHERMTVEVDYHQELLFTQQFKEVLNPKKFLVPDVYPEYSTQKILTTEFLEGKHLDEFLVDEPSQEVRNQLAQNLWDLFIQQLYQFKKIHADPNPGNYLFLNDGRIGILDFGCIKEFDEQFIERFRQLSHTLYSGSTSDVV
ncbi:MAG: putative unusual protein kinase regulating ubiquinone biosynthesis (AarF/ABC1/UbiB family), partial [bacterium]